MKKYVYMVLTGVVSVMAVQARIVIQDDFSELGVGDGIFKSVAGVGDGVWTGTLVRDDRGMKASLDDSLNEGASIALPKFNQGDVITVKATLSAGNVEWWGLGFSDFADVISTMESCAPWATYRPGGTVSPVGGRGVANPVGALQRLHGAVSGVFDIEFIYDTGAGTVTTVVDGETVHDNVAIVTSGTLNYAFIIFRKKNAGVDRGYLDSFQVSVGPVSNALSSDPISLSQPRVDSPLKTGPGIETLVVLPDTQFYVHFPQTYHYFMDQIRWIVENKSRYNIKYVIHVGDIENMNTPEQWKMARAAMAGLDGQVPYAVVGGNHDYGAQGTTDTRQTLMNDYFSPTLFKRSPHYGGLYRPDSMENSCHLFSLGKQKIMILNLEWGPRDEVVLWANQMVAQHPECRVILNTHAYLYYDDTRYDWDQYGKKQDWNPKSYKLAADTGNGGINDGQDLWVKLVSKHKGFFLTLNGHVCGDGLARLVSEGEAGNAVNQVLVNYQWPMYEKKGGQGYLRIMQFLPDGETVFNASYSPSLNEYRTDDQNQFILRIHPRLNM